MLINRKTLRDALTDTNAIPPLRLLQEAIELPHVFRRGVIPPTGVDDKLCLLTKISL